MLISDVLRKGMISALYGRRRIMQWIRSGHCVFLHPDIACLPVRFDILAVMEYM